MAKLKEHWLPIPYLLDYLVSTDGRVKSAKSGKPRKPTQYWRKRKSGKPFKCGCRITIRGKHYPVHRAVMDAFKPNYGEPLSVDHIDRNPFNNNLNNLRWATVKEQALNRERQRKTVIVKITPTELNLIYLRTKKESLTCIGKEYGISGSDLCKLLLWLHPEY